MRLMNDTFKNSYGTTISIFCREITAGIRAFKVVFATWKSQFL